MLKVAVHFLYCYQLKGIDQSDRFHQYDNPAKASLDALLKSPIDVSDGQCEVTLMCCLFA
jgi:hypothetical protein